MKRKILIPIIIAGVIVVAGGGVSAYAYHNSIAFRADVTSDIGIGHNVDFNKLTPDSKYNNFRTNLYNNLYTTVKEATPIGKPFMPEAVLSEVQFLTDNQIQNLTGTQDGADMFASVTVTTTAETLLESNERMVTMQSNNNPTEYAIIRFWNVDGHAKDLHGLDFKIPTKLKEEGAISNPTEIVWGQFGNPALPNFKAKIYAVSYQATTNAGIKIGKQDNQSLIYGIANFTHKQLADKTGTTIEKDMTVSVAKKGEKIDKQHSYVYGYNNGHSDKTVTLVFGHQNK